jgi:hypothetical protein
MRTEEEEKPKEKRQSLQRVSFYGKTFWCTDRDDPDEVIERYVASGKHKFLEQRNPELAKRITERFIEHQRWREAQGQKVGKRG